MTRLENLKPGASVRGILPDGLVTVLSAKWYGTNVLEVTYKDAQGKPGNELIYRDREPTLELAASGRPWSFEAGGALFRLVSEAYRIRLAYLFDPLLAVHTSIVEPLPHQIKGVYGEMLGRQPPWTRRASRSEPPASSAQITGHSLTAGSSGRT